MSKPPNFLPLRSQVGSPYLKKTSGSGGKEPTILPCRFVLLNSRPQKDVVRPDSLDGVGNRFFESYINSIGSFTI